MIDMRTIDKNDAPTAGEVNDFLRGISFSVPVGFMEFYRQANGADVNSDKSYTILWALTEMVQLNESYGVEEYAPEFFIFGSDGGDTAFAIEKSSGKIFEMPFIGMSKEEAVFRANDFDEFLMAR